MKNKITLIIIFLIAVLVNLHVFTDAFSDTAIPKVRLYGTGTYWADSSNYQTTNKSIYIHDSLKVGSDIYVGVKGGKIYLDTNRKAQIEYVGNTFKFTNNKNSGGFSFENSLTTTDAGFSFILGEGVPAFTIYKYRNGQLRTVVVYDTLNGFKVNTGGMGNYDNDKGYMKFPTLTQSERDALTAVAGMTVFNTDTGNLQTYDGSTWRDLY